MARSVVLSTVAELCDLRWDQVEFNAGVLHVRRVKNGTRSTHPLRGDELRALRRLQRESETSAFVFVSERGSPFTTAGFARMIERTAASAGLPTCSATPVATLSPTRATTLGQSRLGSAIDRLRALRSTRPWRRTGSRTSGGTEQGKAGGATPIDATMAPAIRPSRGVSLQGGGRSSA
jgi:integrase